MANYEIVLIFSPKVGDAAGKFIEVISKLVAEAKGKITKQDGWGKKVLAYPIKKFDEGVYYYLELSVPASEIGRIERRIKVEDGVIRYLVVNK